MEHPAAKLRGGVDYPRDRIQFDEFFPDEESCHAYLARLRWPDGFVCARCGGTKAPWKTSRGVLVCSSCQTETSVLAGTIFHNTRTPLRTWFLAAWGITSQKYGVSALGLQRELGLKSYQTAWAWLHKFRRAMVRQGRDQLRGVIEADESYIGGQEAGVHGRETVHKAIVAIAVEVNNDRIGRIRLRVVPDVSGKSLRAFLKDTVTPGSTVHTDGWRGYSKLKSLGFGHEVTVLSASPDPAHVLMPAVHRVASLLKRWVLGTHQGGIAKAHLPYYLDEFTFRFNRRMSRARGLLFHRLLEQAVRSPPTPTATLYRGTGRGPRRR